jgi:hypothetical protein
MPWTSLSRRLCSSTAIISVKDAFLGPPLGRISSDHLSRRESLRLGPWVEERSGTFPHRASHQRPMQISRRASAVSRSGLLACGSGQAVLATVVAMPLVLLSASVGGSARAQSCGTLPLFNCVYILQPAQAPSGSDNGDAGSPGTPVPAVTFNFPSTLTNGLPNIVGIVGGAGGDGRNSHFSELDKDGGDGGIGGNGNTLTVTMQGVNINGGVTIGANGGAGGAAGNGSHGGTNGTAGSGGTAGSVVAGTQAAPLTGQISGGSTSPALTVVALGGAGSPGANFDNASPDTSVDDGGDAGDGGNSNGGVSVVFQGVIGGGGGGIVARSEGGNGGAGGVPIDVDFPVGAQGGNGGNGGTAGPVSVILMSGSTWIPNLDQGVGITAQSFGGQGGVGGAAQGDASGGTAGTGTDGGTIFVANDGQIVTNSINSPGILAQSYGGAGGTGGTGGGWGAGGGNGGTGGGGGNVAIYHQGTTSTSGTNSQGVMAQSIGGGGGNGGDASGWQSVGGDGAKPGIGRDVIVNNFGTITTTGERSTGIHAQSIGGGGGNGGNATSTGLGPLNLIIGGSGAGGGAGGSIEVSNNGSITTSGLHSSGIVMQAVGGGGGNGGSAYSGVTSAAVGAAVSVGGSGGGGGNGGTVNLALALDGSGNTLPTNSGQILTSGANAFGILGQSLGGGGGVGGLSGASATTYSAATEEIPIPTISVSVAIGGAGGNGGAGQSITLQNTGLIATGGGGAVGLAGQSIGGGGGSGGDASATSSAKGAGDSPVNISSSTALGGSGGSGGAGGPLTITNSGLIFTRGEAADAVLAQSIGGGGGNGGTGDAQAKSSGDGTNISSSVSLGGSGGSGGASGPVSVTSSGAILTLGDGAIGVLAQSVGGGGGRGGGAAGTSNGQFTATVTLGGGGGSGGSTTQPSGHAVYVSNTGTIVTFGADAPGIVAQSIGGGGGLGGKSASSLGSGKSTGDGGNGAAGSVNSTTTSLNAAFQSGGEGAVNQYNSVSGLIGVANSALGNLTATLRLGDDPLSDADDLDDLGGSSGDSGDDSSSTSVTVHVNVGGRGGVAGNSGTIQVVNSGSIGTVGPMSDGIVAQAIGGGGGRGGAAVSSITSGQVNSGDKQGNIPISVGGRGGGGGGGGDIEVDNSGNITTIGAQSIGILAQSISGGGGIAGTSAAKVQGNNAGNTSVLSLPIAIGADGGVSGPAGAVGVNNYAAIITRSHDAIGILAQSINGGGGIVRTRSSDASDNNGGGAVATGGSYGINLTFGGSGGTPNSGFSAGPVGVSHYGSITTGTYNTTTGVRGGNNAYGILAQSIGGGGGVVLGGTPNGTNFFGTGTMSGDAQTVSVTLGNPTGAAGTAGNITTYGQGAVAVLAQSIGGGGGLAGDTGLTAQRSPFTPSAAHNGSGNAVLIQVNPTATLSTSANNTPVILAQSIGGGGGRITNNGYGAYDGTAGGTGTGGTVTVNVSGQVLATGAASPGIFAESVGQGATANPTGGAAIRINVGPGAVVQGGPNFNANDNYGAAIYIVGGSTNQDVTTGLNNNINNQGNITSAGTGAFATAIYSTGGWTSVYNQSGGSITGSVDLAGGGSCPLNGCPAAGGSLTNLEGGTLTTGPLMSLGATGMLANQGTLNIGGSGTVATTAMTGTLVQGPSGRLVVDTNHSTGEADRLDVQGSARLAGTVEVHPTSIANRAVTVLTATGGVNLDAGLATSRTLLFAFDAQSSGNSLQIQPRAEFTQAAASLGSNQQRVAAHLQELWSSSANMDPGFNALADVNDPGSYARSLNSLSGQTVGAIAAFRFSSSRTFVSNMFSECPSFEGAGITESEASCSWGRVFGSFADQSGTGGALGYQTSAWTFQAGGQKQIAPNWFLGGSVAYETSVFRGDAGSSKVSGDSLLLGATLRYQEGPWQVAGALDFGYGWYDSQRAIEAGSFRATASAKPDAWHVGAHARIAYTIPFQGSPEGSLEGWYLQPRLDLHLSHVHSGGYTESGAAPFNLAVESEGATTFTATPAVEVGARIRLSEGAVLRPFASAGVEMIANNDWAATARFAGQPASHGFRASTPIPDVLGKFTVGADLLNSSRWDFRLQYIAETGDGYVSHTGVSRAVYRF